MLTCAHSDDSSSWQGAFSMLSAEPYSDPYAVAMQLGMYTSLNGLDWTRERTLRVSTGLEGSQGDDALHAAHWGAILTKNTANDTWLMSYVGYKAAKPNASGFLANYEGTIFSRYATEPGDAGLDSDFGEAAASKAKTPAYANDVVLLAPDDFPPFPAANKTWSVSSTPLQNTPPHHESSTRHQNTPPHLLCLVFEVHSRGRQWGCPDPSSHGGVSEVPHISGHL